MALLKTAFYPGEHLATGLSFLRSVPEQNFLNTDSVALHGPHCDGCTRHNKSLMLSWTQGSGKIHDLFLDRRTARDFLLNLGELAPMQTGFVLEARTENSAPIHLLLSPANMKALAETAAGLNLSPTFFIDLPKARAPRPMIPDFEMWSGVKTPSPPPTVPAP